jgi:hypothetical protein
MIRVFIPDPDPESELDFLPIPDLAAQKHLIPDPDPQYCFQSMKGSGSARRKAYPVPTQTQHFRIHKKTVPNGLSQTADIPVADCGSHFSEKLDFLQHK